MNCVWILGMCACMRSVCMSSSTIACCFSFHGVLNHSHHTITHNCNFHSLLIRCSLTIQGSGRQPLAWLHQSQGAGACKLVAIHFAFTFYSLLFHNPEPWQTTGCAATSSSRSRSFKTGECLVLCVGALCAWISTVREEAARAARIV